MKIVLNCVSYTFYLRQLFNFCYYMKNRLNQNKSNKCNKCEYKVGVKKILYKHIWKVHRSYEYLYPGFNLKNWETEFSPP